MATEEDKTNTGIAGTAIAVGVAAMIAGSAALVGMARAEMDDLSQETQGYADLSSIRALKAEQTQRLTQAKVSIDKARSSTLSALKGDPDQASPWTPASLPAEASSAAVETAPPASADSAGAASGAVSEAVPSASAEPAAPPASAAPAETAAAPTDAPAPEPPKAPKKKAPKPE